MGSPGPADRRKVFVRIADELRKDIAAGTFPLGEQLPPIAKLVERFGSAKATVERALDVLRGEGLIASRQGSRTVVVALPEEQDAAEEPAEPSEEFRILSGQLQEIRAHIRRLGTRLDELDERIRRSERG
jgi:DNA-binding GntR family transcriptional regulator